MNWFQNLSVRLKILSVAGLGIVLFLVYAVYSFYIAETNINNLKRIEKQDFPVLELVNANNVDFIAISESFIAAISQADPDLLQEARSRATEFVGRLDDIRAMDPALADSVDGLQRSFKLYIGEASELAKALIEGDGVGDDLYQRITQVRELQDAYEAEQKAFEEQRYSAFRETLNTSRADNLGTQKIGLLLGAIAFVMLAL
ncbi:MAG: hypothetical protein MI751_05025, partial [Pseudomonadales bacterium]|nr:hypothetical protein [Pseudomonadales bacterium]